MRYDNPTRVQLEARLQEPGLVILADTLDDGWHLTIDGKPAPILQANRLMRGAAVSSGTHTLVYTFEPVLGPAWYRDFADQPVGISSVLRFTRRFDPYH